jgi:hypothetical protein
MVRLRSCIITGSLWDHKTIREQKIIRMAYFGLFLGIILFVIRIIFALIKGGTISNLSDYNNLQLLFMILCFAISRITRNGIIQPICLLIITAFAFLNDGPESSLPGLYFIFSFGMLLLYGYMDIHTIPKVITLLVYMILVSFITSYARHDNIAGPFSNSIQIIGIVVAVYLLLKEEIHLIIDKYSKPILSLSEYPTLSKIDIEITRLISSGTTTTKDIAMKLNRSETYINTRISQVLFEAFDIASRKRDTLVAFLSSYKIKS